MIKALDMGFLVARLMRTYGMRLLEVLDLPVRTFWMLHRAIDRMQAELDYRMVAVIGNGMAGGEGLENLVKGLRSQMGTIVEYEEGKAPIYETEIKEDFDREGLESLKGLGRL